LLEELNTKATELYHQGKFSNAEKVTKKVLKVTEKTFGTDHPNIALSVNNLALLYKTQGKYMEPNLFTRGHWK